MLIFKPFLLFMYISLIAAMSENRVIGRNNQLPWQPIKADWDNLENVTKGCKMIMGRKSYDNPHRVWSEAGNFVVTRQEDYQVDAGFEIAGSLEEAIEKCKNENEIYILGGEEIFRMAISIATKIVLTVVHQNFEGDAFFPTFDEKLFEIIEKKDFGIGENTPYPISIITYLRK